MSEKTASQKSYEEAKEKGNLNDRGGDWIKFKGEGERILKFVDDERYKGENFKTGEEEWKMKYTFEEDGKEVFYETALKKRDPETHEQTDKISFFVQQMAQFDYGDKIRAEYKPIEGTPRGFIDLEPVNQAEQDDDIPVIEENEQPNPNNNPEDM